jgi:hypothetical protein
MFKSQDVGCFSKSSSLPLVLSHPYASAIREKLYAGRFKEQKEIEDLKSKESKESQEPKELTAEEKQEVNTRVYDFPHSAIFFSFAEFVSLQLFFRMRLLSVGSQLSLSWSNKENIFIQCTARLFESDFQEVELTRNLMY